MYLLILRAIEWNQSDRAKQNLISCHQSETLNLFANQAVTACGRKLESLINENFASLAKLCTFLRFYKTRRGGKNL